MKSFFSRKKNDELQTQAHAQSQSQQQKPTQTCRHCKYSYLPYNSDKCEKCGCELPLLSIEAYKRLLEKRREEENAIKAKIGKKNPMKVTKKEMDDLLDITSHFFKSNDDDNWFMIGSKYEGLIPCKVKIDNTTMVTSKSLYIQNCVLLYEVSQLSKQLQTLTKKFEDFESKVEIFPGGDEYEKTKNDFENLQNKETF